MILENRCIENCNGFLSSTIYILLGDKPLPKAFIDEIGGYVYYPIGYDSDERCYTRKRL